MSSITIQSIIDGVKQVSMSPSSLEALLDFERVLDSNNIYAFENWKYGELVEGPILTKYRVKCTFCWPRTKMPDPAAGARLLPYGAIIHYSQKWLVYPIEIHDEFDYKPGTKKAKTARTKVWLVEIDLPKHLIRDITRGSEEILAQDIDMESIDDAYEAGLDTDNATMDDNNQG